AATDDPAALKADSTWFMSTNLTPAEADPAQVYCVYRLRDWIEHYYKPAKHELGWADFQVRPERAIVRHWHLVMLAFTFSLLAGAPAPPAAAPPATELLPPPTGAPGGKIGAAPRLASHAARRARVAVPLGAPPTLLGPLEHSPAPAGARCPARPCRTVAPAWRPNLTNQRLGTGGSWAAARVRCGKSRAPSRPESSPGAARKGLPVPAWFVPAPARRTDRCARSQSQ